VNFSNSPSSANRANGVQMYMAAYGHLLGLILLGFAVLSPLAQAGPR
jgi:hypothetical protein